MSHFKILVIGSDHEEVLAPYNEQDSKVCTAHERLDEMIKDFEKYGSEYGKTLKEFIPKWIGCDNIYDITEKRAIQKAKMCHENHIICINDEVVSVINYWNDDAKYDYYTNMGKQGADSWMTCLYDTEKKKFCSKIEDIRNLDVDKIMEKAAKEAGDDYDTHINAFKEKYGRMPVVPHTWNSIIALRNDLEAAWNKQHGEEDTEDKNKYLMGVMDIGRKIYNEQEDVKAWEDLFGWYDERPDDYTCSREEYIKNNTQIGGTAIVTPDGWFERGTVGWWGMWVSKVMPLSEWNEKQLQIIREMKEKAIAEDDDTISVEWYDCHI